MEGIQQQKICLACGLLGCVMFDSQEDGEE